MSNEVIHEIKVTETEDGFTIEMKGDKEALREMIFSARGLNLYGKGRWGERGSRRHGEHRHRHRGNTDRKSKRHGRQWGRGRWRERMRDHEHDPKHKHSHGEPPEYDLGPWLETDGTDEATKL